MFDARSASSRMTDSGSLRAAGTCGTSLRKSAKPDHRREGVVEVVGDAGDELPDGGQLFRLDELVLQSPPLRLVIEEQDEGGAVGAGNRHGGNGIGPIAGAEIHLAARSLLIQGPLQIGGHSGGTKACHGRPIRLAGGASTRSAKARLARRIRPPRSTMQMAGEIASTTSCHVRRPSSCRSTSRALSSAMLA